MAGLEVVRYPKGDWRKLAAQARELESAGVQALWLADHPERAGVLEPWTALAALAETTERLLLGTAATNASLRDPAVLAKQVATVDDISGGRVQVAIGAGDGGRTETIAAALDEISGVPLYVAANARRGLELAAERGVGSLSQGDGRIRERMTVLRELGVGERLFFAGWADERPFASPQACEEFVAVHREAGVTRFLFPYASDAKGGRFLTRESLDTYAPLLAHLLGPDDEEEVRDT